MKYLLKVTLLVGLCIMVFGCSYPLDPFDPSTSFEESDKVGELTYSGLIFESGRTLEATTFNYSDHNLAYDITGEPDRWLSLYPKESDEFGIEISGYGINLTAPTQIKLLHTFTDNISTGKVEFYAKFDKKTPYLALEDDNPRYLYFDSGGKLTYEIKYEGVLYPATTFTIKNCEADPLQCGEDFVFGFFAENEKSFADQEAIDDFIGFFGIVDYNLLDGANLYIDEGEDILGNSLDWNGDFQADIPSFTWHNHDQSGDIEALYYNENADDTNTPIENSVAYSTGCQDNPTEFKDKMEQQRICIQEFSKYAQEYNESILNDGDPGNDDDVIIVNPDDTDIYYTDWTETTAPEGKWTYYVKAKDAIDAKFCADESLGVFDEYKPEAGYPLYGIRPYIPGYSSIKKLYGYPDTNYYYRGQSAGTDCVGFVQRSAGYDGNPYVLTEIGSDYFHNGEHPWTWHNGTGDGGAAEYVNGRQLLYYSNDNNGESYTVVLNKVTDSVEEEDNPKVVRKILPGDIMYYWTTNGYHVGIVDRVDYSDYDTRSKITLEDIKLIEATWAHATTDTAAIGNVINIRSLEIYSSNPLNKSWRIGRLKKE